MNTFVSPLPLPIWPMLGLSLTLVAFTATAVTLSAHRATQIYPNTSQTTSEATAPITAQDLARNRLVIAASQSVY